MSFGVGRLGSSFGRLGRPGGRKIIPFPFAPGGTLPSHDIDFAGGRAYANGSLVTPSSLLTVTRASQETITDTSGNLTYASNNTAALSNAGLQVWESRTNVVLWNNDLTNAAWTASNVTAAKDQVGPDNVLNSASSILATAANATILQSITLGSSARFQFAYVKRLSGSGVINMTMDGGTTWTPIIVTGSWAQVAIPTHTEANPVVGFQIVASGDKIAVALVQNENGSFGTPAIPTTTAAVTRAADVILLASPPSFGTSYSVAVWGTPAAPTAYATLQAILQIDDGTVNNRIAIRRAASTAIPAWIMISGGSTIFGPTNLSSGAWEPLTPRKIAASFVAGTQRSAFSDGGTNTQSGATLPTSISRVALGMVPNGNQFDGNISRLIIWPTTALTAAQLQQTTS